jgi:hypothetical protein
MAVLPDGDRQLIVKNYSSDISALRVAFDVRQPDLKAAVDAVDLWVDNNTAAYNAAIPLPARTQMTTQQKAQLLMYVVRRRFEVG